MASREFLKTMKEARQGDVFSQHRLGDIYLNGEFGTPKQPANALIWLHKAYEGFLAKGASDACDQVVASALKLPFAETLSSPSAEFAWSCFSMAANQENNVEAHLEAKWQIGTTLLESDSSPVTQLLIAKHFDHFFPNTNIREQAVKFLESIAQSNSAHSSEALELIDAKRPTAEKIQILWQSWNESKDKQALIEAAELGYGPAQLTVGLQLAKLDQPSDSDAQLKEPSQSDPNLGSNSASNSGSASLKKAVQWLSLAAKQGERDAWYNLALIYRRPQFSGYSAQESDRCIDQAADLGHPEAQFKKGTLLWRKRSSTTNSVSSSDTSFPWNDEIPELKASYWIWQAAQQGVTEAIDMLPKILSSCPKSETNLWFELAQKANLALSKTTQVRLPSEWVPLCHRLIVGNQFSLSKAEMLLVNIPKMQHEHCVVVDIRELLPKSNPRLIQIDTLEQRKSLLLASKIFASDDDSSAALARFDEGNLRQRRYRFEKLSEWLDSNFSVA
jgi:TPR repeat protein